MRISAEIYRMRSENEEVEPEAKESVCNGKDVEAHINEWVEWFHTQLQEAAKAGEDVEILLGRKRKTNNYTV